jgi:nucleotide-binding universal stress UspA family protein
MLARDTEIGEETLRTAGEHAAGIGAELIVLSAIDENEYKSTLQRSSATRIGEMESVDDVESYAKQQASQQAENVFSDIDVEYRVVSEVVPLPDGIITFAEENDCSHIYIVTEERSPTGKVLFGDLAQSVLLNFDGPVTIRTE